VHAQGQQTRKLIVETSRSHVVISGGSTELLRTGRDVRLVLLDSEHDAEADTRNTLEDG